MNIRQTRIMEYVIDHERVEVAQLAEQFGVSQVTIRKDLDALETAGIVKREHGWAVAAPADSMPRRMAYHYEAKLRIAQAAAATVSDGETLMVESGSCCALFAREVSQRRRGITIITNSAYIADFLGPESGAHVVLLGGDYQPDSRVLVGPITAQAAQNFFVDHLFIGADGYTTDTGFTSSNLGRAETVRALARQARNVTILSESAKFPHRGEVHLLDTDQVDRIVTDDALSTEMVEQFTAADIDVVRVPAEQLESIA